jgi:hypothetical protein
MGVFVAVAVGDGGFEPDVHAANNRATSETSILFLLRNPMDVPPQASMVLPCCFGSTPPVIVPYGESWR